MYSSEFRWPNLTSQPILALIYETLSDLHCPPLCGQRWKVSPDLASNVCKILLTSAHCHPNSIFNWYSWYSWKTSQVSKILQKLLTAGKEKPSQVNEIVQTLLKAGQENLRTDWSKNDNDVSRVLVGQWKSAPRPSAAPRALGQILLTHPRSAGSARDKKFPIIQTPPVLLLLKRCYFFYLHVFHIVTCFWAFVLRSEWQRLV